MKMKLIDIFARVVLLVPLLAACGTVPTAQQERLMPTPLPPDPALERATYTVQRGSIENLLDANGRVTPIDLVRLGFRRAGRVSKVGVKQGDAVKAGDVLAELEQDDKRATLHQAEDGLAQAQRDLDSARQQHADAVRQAELELQEAQEDLARLMPGNADDPTHNAQRDLEQAQQAADTGSATASEAKTNAEHDVLLKTEAVQDAQQSYSTAWWDNDWVLKYGTHPTEMVTDPRTGRKLHRRQMPVPYGSGGSGAVQEQDRTTRIQVTDTKGQELASGAVVKIRIVLEHKDSVLWLPPDAVRSFEGRRFVVVREGDRERRVTVKTGIETEDKIEIVEGVKEGDLIVGQ